MASQRRPWLMDETRHYWPLMTAYERFEHIIAFILSLLIAVLIVLALVQLFVRVVPLLVTGALDLGHRFELFLGVELERDFRVGGVGQLPDALGLASDAFDEAATLARSFRVRVGDYLVTVVGPQQQGRRGFHGPAP